MASIDGDEGDLTEEQHRAIAAELVARWEAGESKSSLEVEFWDDPARAVHAATASMSR